MIEYLKIVLLALLLDSSFSQIYTNEDECFQKIDLIFVLDASSSVGRKGGWIPMKNWVKDMAEELNIENGNVQIGVVQYSLYEESKPWNNQSYIKTEISLGKFKNLTKFNQKINEMLDVQGGTDTAHAMEIVLEHNFEGSNNRYPDAQRVIILVTDGRAEDENLIPRVIELAREKSVAIYAIGIGDVDVSELALFAGNDSSRIYSRATHNNLNEIKNDLLNKVQGVCDCDPEGSANLECNSCTRNCTCKRNVVGRRCDRCAPFYYGFGRERGCQRCGCYLTGTVMSTCDGADCNCTDQGDCECLPNVKGKKCDQCIPGTYQMRVDRGCIDCDCYPVGSIGTECDEETGQCNCRINYAGRRCDECATGHFIIPGQRSCLPCQCSEYGTQPNTICTSLGNCLCKEGYTGRQCTDCDTGYYRRSGDIQCSECNCDPYGTQPGSICGGANEPCRCKEGYVGAQCNECALGYVKNRGECRRCGCNPNGVLSGTTCDPETLACSCKTGFVGPKCSRCDDLYVAIPGGCLKCDCNRNGIVPGSTCNRTTFTCKCKTGYVGPHCSACRKGFYYILGGCQECRCNLYGINQGTSCDQETGYCRSNCKTGYIGPYCTTCDIGYFSILGRCHKCQCNQNGIEPKSICNSATGECNCKVGFIGRECSECDEGFFSIPGGCKRCWCDPAGVLPGSTCDSITGKCRCKEGFTGPTCHRCADGYFVIVGGCQKCWCNPAGVEPGTTCDQETRKCQCKQGFSGRRCERCAEGYYTILGGCKSCECNPDGTAPGRTCDKNGKCPCKEGYGGRQCSNCDIGYVQVYGDRFKCRDCPQKIDVIFLIDSSGSLGSDGFNLIKDWVNGLASDLHLDDGNIQVGVVKYSSYNASLPLNQQKYIRTEVKLGEFQDLQRFKTKINEMRYFRGTTNTAHALDKILTYDFVGPRNRYPEAKRVIVLLTDGKSSDPQYLPEVIDKARRMGVVIFAVGVGDYNITELRQITSYHQNRITEVEDLSRLASVAHKALQELSRACDCSDLGSVYGRCDPCTRQCLCKANVIGRRCDKCAPEYYGIENTGECSRCQCDRYGTVPNTACDQTSGQCVCKEGFNGRTCSNCESGYKAIPGGCQKCENPIDLMVAIDGSESVGPSNFNEIKNWLKRFAAAMRIDLGYTFIGVVHYSQYLSSEPLNNQSWIKTIVELGRDRDLASFNRSVNKMEFHAGQTFTAHALKKILDYDFVGGNNRFPAAKRAILLVTDGSSTDASFLPQVLIQAKEMSANIFVVGINSSNSLDMKEIEQIADYQQDRIFIKKKFNQLQNVVDAIQGNISAVCDCDPEGSAQPISCDSCTGKCVCKPFVVGRRCNECARNHYGFGRRDGCKECDCDPKGVLPGSICDPLTGSCVCKEGYDGRKCSNCTLGYIPMLGVCRKCNCNPNGIVPGTTCNSRTLTCECKTGYVGPDCFACDGGFYYDPNGCRKCRCNPNGVIPNTACDQETGECTCKKEYIGRYCGTCDNGYFSILGRCQKCRCNENGVEPYSVCNRATGECNCKVGFIGRECSECDEGFFSIPGGCKRCWCNPAGTLLRSTCNSITGECRCKEGFTGPTCHRCADGYFVIVGGCQRCWCNPAGVEPGTTCDQETRQCHCKQGFSGQRCKKCAEEYYAILGGCKKCACNSGGTIPGRTCDENGKCPCKEGYGGQECSNCDVGYVQVFGSRFECRECPQKIDVILLLDSSGSVKDYGFNLIKDWVKGLASDLHLDRGHIRVGVVKYSSYNASLPLNQQQYIRTEVELGEFQDLQQFDEKINEMKYFRGTTNTAHALDKILTYDFVGPGNRYPEAKRVIVLLTDGKSSDPQYLPEVIDKARRMGVVIFAVGVGDYNITELRQITSYHQNRITEVEDLSRLASVAHKALQELSRACDCSDSGSVHDQCDPCTGRCLCKANVIGRRCDKCAPDHYGIENKDGCKGCQCDRYGTVPNTTCDQNSGQCVCKEGFTGRNCSECESGYQTIPGGCQKCENPIDLIILVDGSGSVGSTNFLEIKNWLKRFASTMRIDLGYTYIGVVNYSYYKPTESLNNQSYIKTIVKLGQDQDLDSFNRSIDKMKYTPSGQTFTAHALKKVLKVDFVGGNNRYPAAKRAILLITDGNSTDSGILPQTLALAKNMSVKIFVVGINSSNSLNMNEIEQIADYQQNRIFIKENFNQSKDVDIEIQRSISAGGWRTDYAITTYNGKDDVIIERLKITAKDCDCDPEGSAQPISCDSCTGKCVCKPFVVGRQCNECARNHYGFGRRDGCKKCRCDLRGTNQTTCVGVNCNCSNSGQCDCLPNVEGKRCDNCSDNFYQMRRGRGCKPCNCDEVGTRHNSTCNKVTGNCPCKTGYMGRRCSMCKEGFMLINGRCLKKPKTSTTPATTTPSSTPCIPTSWFPCWDCFPWPAYCRSWICRRRWPYQPQQPSSRRCHPYDWGCRMSIEYFRDHNPNFNYRWSRNRMSTPERREAASDDHQSWLPRYYHHRRQSRRQ